MFWNLLGSSFYVIYLQFQCCTLAWENWNKGKTIPAIYPPFFSCSLYLGGFQAPPLQIPSYIRTNKNARIKSCPVVSRAFLRVWYIVLNEFCFCFCLFGNVQMTSKNAIQIFFWIWGQNFQLTSRSYPGVPASTWHSPVQKETHRPLQHLSPTKLNIFIHFPIFSISPVRGPRKLWRVWVSP